MPVNSLVVIKFSHVPSTKDDMRETITQRPLSDAHFKVVTRHSIDLTSCNVTWKDSKFNYSL